jgi:hypothetical protein
MKFNLAPIRRPKLAQPLPLALACAISGNDTDRCSVVDAAFIKEHLYHDDGIFIAIAYFVKPIITFFLTACAPSVFCICTAHSEHRTYIAS